MVGRGYDQRPNHMQTHSSIQGSMYIHRSYPTWTEIVNQMHLTERHTHAREDAPAFRSRKTSHEPQARAGAHTTRLSCESEMSSVSTMCAVCALPAVSPPGAVTQSPDTHSAWMTASSSHDAAGATRLVPPGLCTRTVHGVRGCHRGGTESVCERL